MNHLGRLRIFLGSILLVPAVSLGEISGRVTLGAGVYGGSKVEPNHQTQSVQGTFLVNHQSESSPWKASIGLDVRNEAEANPYPLLKELNYTWEIHPALDIQLGLAQHSWSKLDDRVRLGLWNSITTYDRFQSEAQGQVGVGLNLKRDTLKVRAFVAPIFIPNIGPQFQQKSGQLLSENRWFQQPVTQVELFDQLKPVSYDTSELNEEGIVLQPSVWLGVQYSDQAFINFSTAYKPVNEVLTRVEEPRLVTTSASDFVQLKVRPTVARELINTIEFGFADESLQIGYSFTSSQIEKIEDDRRNYLHPQLNDVTVQGVWLSHGLDAIGLPDSMMSWGAFQAETQTAIEASESELDIDFSFDRFYLDEGVFWSVDFPVWRIRLNSDLIYSPKQNGSMLSFGASSQLANQIRLQAKYELIGVEDEDSNEDDFLNRFRNNDRIYLGVIYDF